MFKRKLTDKNWGISEQNTSLQKNLDEIKMEHTQGLDDTLLKRGKTSQKIF